MAKAPNQGSEPLKRRAVDLLFRVNRLPTWLAIKLIHGYRYFLSPWVGNQCRFYPTCSQYAEDVYRQFGFFKGSWLTLKRLLKCNPWSQGGIDLPPGTKTETKHCCHTQHTDNSFH